MRARNEQETFWIGEFGNEYIARNQDDAYLISNIELFSRLLKRMPGMKSAIEFGANTGLNLRAIKTLVPTIELSAIEINANAVAELKKYPWITVHHQSVVEYTPTKQFDLVFIKGVLIHINPDDLNHVYELLYKSSKKYILVAEYYNRVPVTIEYRGYKNKLFKRDFAGEMLDKFSDLKLIDYGFGYYRDTCFLQDDTSWFLLEK